MQYTAVTVVLLQRTFGHPLLQLGLSSVRTCLRRPDTTCSPRMHTPGGRFTKYLTTILRLSYDNAIVTIDLRRMTNLPNRLTKGARLFLGMIHVQNCKIV